MISSAVKNFFTNLIYLFVAMGIVYLVFIMVLFAFVSSTFSNLGVMLDSSIELINTTVQNSQSTVEDFISYSMAQIEWDGNFFETIQQILDTNWIQNTLTGFMHTLSDTAVGFTDDFTAIIDDFANKLVADAIISVTFLVLGIMAANYATRFVIRRKNARRTIKKAVIAAVLLPIVQSIILIAAVMVYSVLEGYSLLVYAAIIITYGVMALISSWLVHNDGSIKIGEVVNAKNVFTHLVGVVIIIAIDILVAVILWQISPIFDVLFMVPFVIYSLNIIDVNTDYYVCQLIEHKGKLPVKDKKVKAEK